MTGSKGPGETKDSESQKVDDHGHNIQNMRSWKRVLCHWVPACQEVVVIPHADHRWSNGEAVTVDPGAWEELVEFSPHGENAEHPPNEEGNLEALHDTEYLDSSLDLKEQAASMPIESVFRLLHF